jgi:hypothetical protein
MNRAIGWGGRYVGTLTALALMVGFFTAPASAQVKPGDFGTGATAPKDVSAGHAAAVAQAIISALPVTTILTAGGQKLYGQRIDYKFDGQKAVYVEGLGQLPPSGTLKYLSDNLSVTFETPDLNQVLYETAPSVSQSYYNADIPDPSFDFPKVWREGRWHRKDSFQIVAPAVLNQMGFDCRAYSENDVYFLATPYTDLSNPTLPSYVNAQAALLISQPFDSTRGEFTFHVQAATRERRLKDPVWVTTMDPQIDQLTKGAADSMENNFMAALLNPGKGH